MKPASSKVVIVGVGLIGGSFALAAKAALAQQANAPHVRFVGMGRTQTALDEALRLGVIDEIGRDWPSALRDADLVLIATPVGQMPSVFAAVAPHLAASTLITDGGSTKCDVIAAARMHLGAKCAQFIPAHPIAGAEKSGAAAARSDLFQGRRVVLTPLPENRAEDVERIRTVWRFCGAEVDVMSAEEHDRIFAAVSHLPHLLAYALVHELAHRDNAEQLFGFAAGGFRDFTRIASSHPEMWRDICLANRRALMQELDAYMVELMRTRALLASRDAEGLMSMFAAARARREAWLSAQKGGAE
ncbi:MAG: prephenate dehydrogenase/arogenate dehydrogenase family protein [Rhodocyclaceae bacterium]|nr:prephenate dehydrogenase/arogenate dehydrogenase family protein [Rhodocyclaceae bacterium]